MPDDLEDWRPVELPPSSRFKWGFDAARRQFTIWEVGAVGDGLPDHASYLRAAWGRPPRPPRDRIGYATVRDGLVTLVAYYDAELPSEAEAWARATFPAHRVETSRVGVNS
jgi:hypothetical protein